jgi:uncharacterized protein with HEPN domain
VRGDAERLRDIAEAIERIEKYAVQGREAFESDELIQTWYVHNIEIIGEAARALSPELRVRHPDVPWAAISAMRNVLVHEYFHIDLEEVWSAVERDLPQLKERVEEILSVDFRDG